MEPDRAWIEELRRALLQWFAEHRRELPWRRVNDDPYAIWIAEVMLQQTQVATVIPYYERFMRRFPTLESLAEAPSEEVLKHWEGLGYYSRARNLQEAAQQVVREHDSRLPAEAETLQRLPGIGRYTAGAIASIAFGQVSPVVDGNVSRVLARLFWLKGDLKKPSAQSLLWNLARQLVDPHSPGDFNQAMMELGSTVCTPAAPECGRCPVAHLCAALQRGEPSAVPEASPSKPSRAVTDVSAIVLNNGWVLIAKRPPQGLWGGLWEFPRITRQGKESIEQLACQAAQELVGIQVKPREPLIQIKHQVTYHAIRLHGYLCDYDAGEINPVGYQEARWVLPENLPDLPLSAPQRQLADHLLMKLNGADRSLFD
jgi:A/G-specific adenine glycosylase